MGASRWRKRCAAAALLAAMALAALVASACSSGALLSGVSLSQSLITPNADATDDVVAVNYHVSRNSHVSIAFLDTSGKVYYFRDSEARSPGSYSGSFDGSYAAGNGTERRVLANGDYECVVTAVDSKGRTGEWRGRMQVREADTVPPRISDLVVYPQVISPNDDAIDDESNISFSVDKASQVEVYVEDVGGNRSVIQAPSEGEPTAYAFLWDATSGGKTLSDGDYTLHVVARDAAGNVSEGTSNIRVEGAGNPKLKIVSVKFSPKSIPKGGVLNVEIKVRNAGDTTLRSLGPPPGTPYDTTYNFMQFKGEDGQPLYYERAGFWRVGVGWDAADRPCPVRWGLGKDLLPGEEAVITGTIRVDIDKQSQVRFWASVVQEGVGFPGGDVGQTFITVSY